jgi:hypothetical protein
MLVRYNPQEQCFTNWTEEHIAEYLSFKIDLHQKFVMNPILSKFHAVYAVTLSFSVKDCSMNSWA